MKTSEYVKKFKLDDINFTNHFNTDLFLKDFSEEFSQRIEDTRKQREKNQLEFTFNIFQVIIREMQDKFLAISHKKIGGPLNKGLWAAFYAKTVIPIRKELFPIEHQEIEERRQRYMENNSEELNTNTQE